MGKNKAKNVFNLEPSDTLDTFLVKVQLLSRGSRQHATEDWVAFYEKHHPRVVARVVRDKMLNQRRER
jgi:hypothetical protein